MHQMDKRSSALVLVLEENIKQTHIFFGVEGYILTQFFLSLFSTPYQNPVGVIEASGTKNKRGKTKVDWIILGCLGKNKKLQFLKKLNILIN